MVEYGRSHSNKLLVFIDFTAHLERLTMLTDQKPRSAWITVCVFLTLLYDRREEVTSVFLGGPLRPHECPP